MSIVVVGAVFVDVKGFPEDLYLPTGRNAGEIKFVHGGVGRNVAEDIANVELRPTFVSLVDNSAQGEEVLRNLQRHKVNTDYIRAVPSGMGMWLAVFDQTGDLAGSISQRPDLSHICDILDEKGDEIFKNADSLVIEVDIGKDIVKRALDRLLAKNPDATLDEIAEEVKHTSYRVTRVGELVGHEVARALGVPFGVVDLALAPTSKVGDSVGEIYQTMGIGRLGAPGTTAAVMMLNDAVKKGGSFASSSVGGLSGAFIPVMEDHAMSEAVTAGTLTLEKLEAMTSVCSVGLDMILVPGDTPAETIAGLYLDEAAIGVTNRKTTGVRVIPVPGAGPGEFVDFGGLFGYGTVVAPACPEGSAGFVRHGGHIPAPIHSLSN